ncbi:myb-like dna-binding protein myb-1 [Acrodontium crateriforme]|uniref:Myb-like dna-binding protein myb-1 n=1 Tax=Acrodontium crateriforme TaxID=150365 RepID=A0AAQ3R7B7_9PEZI|nr:myb-like dna-binding protein myb-1 [Acrodontium crateriforme]
MTQHKRGPWSQAEDQYLLHLVSVHGAHNWVRISAAIQSRSPKQCRERFHQNLKPNLNHDPITPEEGILIEQMVAEMGKRWAEIARRLRGRSDNAVKNWWNGGMNRRRRSNNQRRAELDMRQRTNPNVHIDTMQQPLPSHHQLPSNYPQHAVPQQYFGAPMYHAQMQQQHHHQQMTLMTNSAALYSQRHPGMMEQPLPSPSAYSQMSADGTPSLMSDSSSMSARSPNNGTSPIELPPLSGSREDRRQSTAPVVRLGVPGAFAMDGEYQMQMKQPQQHMLQEAFNPQQLQQQMQQQFHHPQQYLPSQRQPSPMHQMQHQQYQIAPHMLQRNGGFHTQQLGLPSTPYQLPGIGDGKIDPKTGLTIDPALTGIHTPLGASVTTPEGSPKDKMSLSNLTH